MIDLAVLPLFFSAVFFLVLSPGPDLLLISSYASSKGFKAGVMLALGVFCAGILQTLLVAFGLGQLMQSAPLLALAIKITGALYLSYLGIKMLYSWYRKNAQPSRVAPTPALTPLSLINKGLLNNLLNPKALLFFSLFLPQFTTTTDSVSLQILLLGTLLSCFALIMNFGFALIFSQFGKLVAGKFKLGQHIDGLLGLVFLGLATRLAISK